MKSIFYFILAALIVKASYEGPHGTWSTSTDDSLIQECLKIALTHTNVDQVEGDQGDDVSQSRASNIVCKTQIVNGLNIRLYFDLRQERWQCSFYKSFIQTLDVKFENCKQIENENPSEQNMGKPVEEQPKPDDHDDDEAKVDVLNQRAREEDANYNQANAHGNNQKQDQEENVKKGELNNDEANNQEVPEGNAKNDDKDEEQ